MLIALHYISSKRYGIEAIVNKYNSIELNSGGILKCVETLYVDFDIVTSLFVLHCKIKKKICALYTQRRRRQITNLCLRLIYYYCQLPFRANHTRVDGIIGGRRGSGKINAGDEYLLMLEKLLVLIII